LSLPKLGKILTQFFMQTGIVKFFREDKGYGFITDDETQKDIFVHATELGGAMLRQNDKVSYTIVEGKKGLNAIKVKKVD
jgi:cold shock protein